jgi:hypothetical protein
MGSRILALTAGPHDSRLREMFLQLISDPPDVRQFLETTGQVNPPQTGFFWCASPSTAFYTLAAGDCRICLAVFDLTHDEGKEIEARLSKSEISARMSIPPFQEIVEDVLDRSVILGARKGHYGAIKWFSGM